VSARVRPTITEHEYEPVPGLPDRLPGGEQVLWQGSPRWQSLAVHAFHLRALATYFAVLLLARAGWMVAEGSPAGDVVLGTAGPLLFALCALGIVCWLAWATARATLYTVTSRRVVIRQGIALTATVNLPYAAIESASLKLHGEVGDVALTLVPAQRASWLVLWPHVRPWRVGRPQPSLRDVPDAARVGELLTRAFAAAVPTALASPAPTPAAMPRPTERPRPAAPAAA
jgi:hypothetical protein